MDLTGYERFFAGELADYPLPEEVLEESLAGIADLPKPAAVKSGRW
jgi:tryptophan synthase beta chain